jgi:DNA-binding MarR family transcriptional regulator
MQTIVRRVAHNGKRAAQHAREAPRLVPALAFLKQIWRLNHAVEQLSKRMVASFGVTAQQRMVIRCTGSYPRVTPGQLAAELHLDAGTVSATLARLEKRGIVTRRRHEEDGRRVAIELTAAGRALDRPQPGTVEHAVERLLQRVQPSRLREVREVLVILTELLELEGDH